MLGALRWPKEGALWSSSLPQDTGNWVLAEELSAAPAACVA